MRRAAPRTWLFAWMDTSWVHGVSLNFGVVSIPEPEEVPTPATILLAAEVEQDLEDKATNSAEDRTSWCGDEL